MSLNLPGDAADIVIDLSALDSPAGSGAMSLTAWINPASIPGANSNIIAKGNGPSAGAKEWALEIQDNSTSVLRGVIDTGSGGVGFDGTSVIPTATWTFAAMTYDGANKKLFVNAVQEHSSAQTGNIASTASQVYIGAVDNGGPIIREFDGVVADVRIYNRALTVAELQTMLALLGRDNIVFGLLNRWFMRELEPTATATIAGSIKDFGGGQFNGNPLNSPIYIEGILR